VEERTEEQAHAVAEKITALTPKKRFATPEELKGLAVLLASDVASGFITGATIVADGGWYAW
jgi:NAD(P)-dependent dehydrogenase (short-subunit alcohol dehydrogenase family)